MWENLFKYLNVDKSVDGFGGFLCYKWILCFFSDCLKDVAIKKKKDQGKKKKKKKKIRRSEWRREKKWREEEENGQQL